MTEQRNDKTIPTIEIELEAWMKSNCFNFEGYSINGNAILEGFGIDKTSGLYSWYYTERGEKKVLRFFNTEAEIVEYAYNQLIDDKWAKSYCVGFTTDKYESQELTGRLQSLGIDFITDEIPYYGPLNPVFRTFVLGCDYKLVEDLKTAFYKAPH